MTVSDARNAVVSLVYSKRVGGMVDSVKLREALDQLIAAVREEAVVNIHGDASPTRDTNGNLDR